MKEKKNINSITPQTDIESDYKEISNIICYALNFVSCIGLDWKKM